MIRRRVTRTKPRVVHVTTTDMSLDWLLGPQLRAFEAAGFEVIGMSAAGYTESVVPRATTRSAASVA